MIASNVWIRLFNEAYDSVETGDGEVCLREFYELESSTEPNDSARRVALALKLLEDADAHKVSFKKLEELFRDVSHLMEQLNLDSVKSRKINFRDLLAFAQARLQAAQGENQAAYETAVLNELPVSMSAEFLNRVGDTEKVVTHLNSSEPSNQRARFLRGEKDGFPEESWFMKVASFQRTGNLDVFLAAQSPLASVRSFLLLNALPGRPKVDRIKSPSKINASTRRLKSLVKAAAVLEEFEENGSSVDRLRDALNDTVSFEFLEDEMLYLLSAAASLTRAKQIPFRELLLRKYKNLCLNASQGDSDDLFSLESITAKSFQKKNHNRLSSYLKLQKTLANVVLEMSLNRLRKVFSNRQKAYEIEAASKAKLARIVGDHFNNSRGALGKIAQLGAIVESGLPYSIKDELKKNFYDSPSMEFAEVEKIIEDEFKNSAKNIFKDIDSQPLAAGKLGQVHRARLPDGNEVVVKVKYSEIEDEIRQDFRSIEKLIWLLESMDANHDYRGILRAWRDLMLEECDFRREIANQQILKKILRPMKEIQIPEIYPSFSTKNVVTMEFIDGANFQDFCQNVSQREKNKAGLAIFESSIRVMAAGYLKYDFHPGNYLFRDGRVGIIDFGGLKSINTGWESTKAILANDLGKISRLVVEEGWVRDEGQFDFERHLEIERKLTLRPFMTDGDFKFTKDFARQVFEHHTMKSPNFKFHTISATNIHLVAVTWLLYSTLGLMEAEGNFREIYLKVLEDDLNQIAS